VCQLAAMILEEQATSQVTIINGPRQGLIMMRVRESVADSLFNAGEVLVTEVTLELDGQLGFAMTLGNTPRRAMAAAVIDAALRIGGERATLLGREIQRLEQEVLLEQSRLRTLVASTKVHFELMDEE